MLSSVAGPLRQHQPGFYGKFAALRLNLVCLGTFSIPTLVLSCSKPVQLHVCNHVLLIVLCCCVLKQIRHHCFQVSGEGGNFSKGEGKYPLYFKPCKRHPVTKFERCVHRVSKHRSSRNLTTRLYTSLGTRLLPSPCAEQESGSETNCIHYILLYPDPSGWWWM